MTIENISIAEAGRRIAGRLKASGFDNESVEPATPNEPEEPTPPRARPKAEVRKKPPIEKEPESDYVDDDDFADDEPEEGEEEDYEDEPIEEETGDDEGDGAGEPEESEEPAREKKSAKATKPSELDGATRINFKTEDGEERTTTLDNLRALAAKGVNYSGKQELLTIEHQKIGKRLEELGQRFEMDHHMAAQALMHQEQSLHQQLREAEALKFTDFEGYERQRNQLQQQWNQLTQNRHQMAQQWESMNKERREHMLAFQREALLRRRPDFNGDKHGPAIVNTMKAMGYDEGELSNLVDHRVALMALRLSEAEKKISDFEKGRKLNEAKARKKMQKPTQTTPSEKRGRSRPPTKGQKKQALRSKLQKSGSLQDAANLFAEMYK